jgi:amidohydrolase
MEKDTLKTLIEFRKTLHQYPENSGEEKETAKKVLNFFRDLNPSKVIQKLGGHGLAFIFEGKEDGPISLYRCELDGLPIKEENNIKHISTVAGKSHVCGHDGHMAIISGLGMHLSKNPPSKGKVVLLFQPAEETGVGAEAVIKDPKFKSIKPDYAFALHNLPTFDSKQIILKKGAFAAASVGNDHSFQR